MYVISKCCRGLDKNVIDDIDDISNVPRKGKTRFEKEYNRSRLENETRWGT